MSRFAARRDRAVVTFDDALANCQTHARAIVFLPAVKPVKDREDALGVGFIEADTVVLERDTISTSGVRRPLRGV